MSALKWNLKDLFENDELVESSIKLLTKSSLAFRNKYENKLKDVSNFAECIKEYEELLQEVSHIMSYAFLSFASDTTQGAFYAKCEEECKIIEENLLFFELEFCALDDEFSQKLIDENKDYAFYLSNLLKDKKHRLSKQEERIMLYLSSTGADAFARLFDESLTELKVKFEGKKLGIEEILSKLYSKDRSERKRAAKNFSKKLKKNSKLLAYILNTIRKELRVKSTLRAYEDAESFRHISNQISRKSVDALIKTSEANFGIVAKYYKKKKELLGFKELKDYDRYAPLGKDLNIKFDEAKDIVLKAFEAFSPLFSDIAKQAFDEHWIDVYPANNKRGGAFSHSTTKKAHPYVLLNYTDKRRDLFTLAHELGHSIHQKLSYKVSFLNQDTPLTTAETASVFAEMLVFDYVKKNLKNEELLGLYASKIEDIFATLFRQINFTTFERIIHSKDSELSVDEINSIWLKESKKMFQDSLSLSDNYKYWWSYIPHFIHSPFYCYAYSYAQLLVLALYGLYKSKKLDNFTGLYIDMLSSGGSKSPAELIAKFGFNVDDEKFWKIGILEIQNLVDEFLRFKI